MPRRTNAFQHLVYLLKTHTADGAVITESKILADLVTGARREVDITVETTLAGHELLLSIECRDHGRPADVNWVGQMKAKHERLPSHALVLVSRSGFTREAQSVARTWNIETHSLDDFDEADAGKLIARNFYELKPTRVRVHVLARDGSTTVVRAHYATEIFTSSGTSAGMVNDMVSGLLGLPNARQYMETHGQAKHSHFEVRWNLPPEPVVFLRKLRPPLLERIQVLHIIGEAKFDPVEFRVRQARIGGTSFLWGAAVALGSPAVAVVTERADGQAVVSTSVIHKRSLKATRSERGKPSKRFTEQSDAMAARVLAHVRSNQGQRLEEIGRAMKIDTGILKRPIANLLAAKKLKTKGEKRGMKYFVK